MKQRTLMVMASLGAFALGLYLLNPESSSGVSTAWAEKQALLAPLLVGEMAKLDKVIPRPVPSIIVMRDDGSPIALDEFSGKALLINIWASWCIPCKAEMPELAALQTALGDNAFEVVAVTVDRGGIDQARDTLLDWGIKELNLYADPTGKAAIDVARGKLPMSLVVTADGTVLYEFLGPLAWDKPEALRFFETLKSL